MRSNSARGLLFSIVIFVMMISLPTSSSRWAAGGVGLAASGEVGMSAQSADEGGGSAGEDSSEVFEEPIPGTAVSLRLVKIPAGAIEVADESESGGSKSVAVHSLWVSETEIPWEAFDIFVFKLDSSSNAKADAVSRPSKPYLPPDRGFGHAGYAAISLSYQAAVEFCNWLSAKTGHHYRLPTEAEWQYAAAAGSNEDYCFGDDVSELKDYAWYAKNAEWQARRTRTRKPNKWGLYDVHGNVSEWVAGLDGKAVTCGGSFLDPAEELKLTTRRKQDATWQMSDPQIPKSTWWLADCTWVGFRIVCDDGDLGADRAEAGNDGDDTDQ